MKSNEYKERILQEFYKYIGMHHAHNTVKKTEKLMKKSEDIDFPEDLDVWFTEYIKDAKKKENKKKRKKIIISITKRVAIFLIILAIGGFITTISVEAYRVRVFNLITDIKEKYTNIKIEREPEEDFKENDILVESFYYPSYIPEGYKQSNIENYGNLELIYFENDNGDVIEFLQSEQDPDFQVDTEGANTTEININGAEGILVSKEGVNTLFWFTDTNNFYITGKLEQEEIITMAESLEYIK